MWFPCVYTSLGPGSPFHLLWAPRSSFALRPANLSLVQQGGWTAGSQNRYAILKLTLPLVERILWWEQFTLLVLNISQICSFFPFPPSLPESCVPPSLPGPIFSRPPDLEAPIQFIHLIVKCKPDCITCLLKSLQTLHIAFELKMQILHMVQKALHGPASPLSLLLPSLLPCSPSENKVPGWEPSVHQAISSVWCHSRLSQQN